MVISIFLFVLSHETSGSGLCGHSIGQGGPLNVFSTTCINELVLIQICEFPCCCERLCPAVCLPGALWRPVDVPWYSLCQTVWVETVAHAFFFPERSWRSWTSATSGSNQCILLTVTVMLDLYESSLPAVDQWGKIVLIHLVFRCRYVIVSVVS